MNVPELRKVLKKVYPGNAWQRKVDNMKPNQVFAVYFSFKQRGLIL